MNLVTEADKASEKLIVSKLKKHFPEDSIIAEEGSEIKGSSGYSWVIDPIDGTTNFAHKYPFYCISIGLVNNQKDPVLGVVYNPYFNETFYAIKGQGAFLNEKPIKVSAIKELSGALVATGFPYNRREMMQKILSRLKDFLLVVNDVRRSGSAALDICYVACGRNDLYYETGLNAWDCAAAVLIATEAGARASKFDGSPADIFFPEIVVSNSLLHEASLETLNRAASNT